MQVRNMGTIGGALAHADPAADFPAAILAADAQMVIQGPSGKRTVAASDFFQGFFATAVQAGEILVEIRVPVHSKASYQKFYHPASGYAVCGVAAVVDNGKARIGITGVGSGAYRANAVEEALAGGASVDDAASHAVEGIEVLEDPFANAAYRSNLAKELTKRAVVAARA
jgi:carbon-monoxide dehydrogenase medium subunit